MNPPILPVTPIALPGPAQAGNVTGSTAPRVALDGGADFAARLAGALDEVSTAHLHADQLALRAATGDLEAVQDYVIASTEAQLLTQLTVTVRDRAVEAFNDIMRMQV